MIEGVWPVLCTPFRPDGSIDTEAMARVTRFALRCGVAGMVFPGFASEVDELSAVERRRLLEVVLEAAGATPVVAGASAPTLAEVIDRVREVAGLGIRSVMIQAPKSIGADAAAVSGFYRAIADAGAGCEIVLQNAPAPRGSDLSAEAVVTVCRDNPAIRYVKEETIPSGGPISAILAGRPTHVAGVIGGGGARFVVDEFLRGACGAMPAVEIADVHVAMWAALREGREGFARDLYERTLPLLMIQSHARMRFTKRVLMRRGVLDNDVTRARIPAFDARDLAEIDVLLDRISDILAVAPLRSTAP